MAGQQLVASLKANPISVACGALALTLAIGIYVRSSRVPESEEILDQRATQGERINANLQNGVQLAEQFTAISNSRKEIESRLVHADELANNLRFFYKIEADTGTKLVDLRQNPVPVGKPKGLAFYRGISYTVSVRGDYVRILEFLRRLESNQRFCRVMSATVGIGGTEKDRGNELTINLGLEILGVQ